MPLQFVGAGGRLTIYDEGVLLVDSVTALNFAGADITATVDGVDPAKVNITVLGAAATTGWTDGGTVVRLTTTSDTVAIGATSMGGSEKIRIVGDALVESQATGATGAELQLYQASASPADNDAVGLLSFYGLDDNGTPQKTLFAQVQGIAIDVSDTTEDGALAFSVNKAGVATEVARCLGQGLNLAQDGTAGAPGLFWGTDLDTGINHSDNTILLSAAGGTVASFTTDTVILSSAAAGATGLDLQLYQASSDGAADNDVVGQISFYGLDDNGTPQKTLYAQIQGIATDVSDMTEDGALDLYAKVAGTSTKHMSLTAGAVSITADGAEATPSLYWGTDADTGVYHAANALTVTTGATAALTCFKDGASNVKVHINQPGSAANPSFTLYSVQKGLYSVSDHSIGISCRGALHTTIGDNGAAQTLGFFGIGAALQQNHIADAVGDDAATVNAIIDALEAYGLLKTS